MSLAAAPPIAADDPRFRAMADCSPVLLWMSGVDAACHFFNQTWLDFTGRRMEQEVGVGWAEGVHPEDLRRCMDTYLEAFAQRLEFRMEYRLRRHDGEYRWVLDHGRPWFLADGAFAGYIGSCIDISDMRAAHATSERANAGLRDMLREKDALMREVHQRVKNNLQLVSSLLSWQERRAGDTPLSAFADDLRRRIFAIALIHERLYRAQDFAHIDLSGYTRELCQHLAATLLPSGVTLDCQLAQLSVSLDVAVPYGLIVAELVSNACKHAFAGGRRGVVEVRLAGEDGEVRLCVRDDGVGLPPDVLERAGFGLELVRALVDQLHASWTLAAAAGTGGTAIDVRFARGS